MRLRSTANNPKQERDDEACSHQRWLAGAQALPSGHVEIFAAISKGLKDTFAATSHHVSNFKIEIVHQQSATLSCYLYAWHRYKSTDVIGHLWGQYHLELIKTIGGWKISNLVLKGTATQDFHRTSMHSIGRLP